MPFRALIIACQVASVASAACSAADETWIKSHFRTGDVSFADMNNDCEHASFSIFSGFNMDSMKTCIKGKTNMTDSCAQCWANHGQYGISNCKLPCLIGWCNTNCLSCLNKDLPNINKCTGFNNGVMTTCNGKVQLGQPSSTELVAQTTPNNSIVIGAALIGWSALSVMFVRSSVVNAGQEPLLEGCA
eukprot:gnl/MRDRNA2_/MRDRNA2_24957_c0_seq2.p1 gnl/MRDRNA2_/MRDRNA2_24957_c0~~gnl/MRDRNA2_/MRDRNA2_24957_c0_seq2.p1  ORF type:complete len:188 (-),score=11.82 gnl/MRDRNA2_/MRDRNA2_24957_c0_seq2:22-585(-)